MLTAWFVLYKANYCTCVHLYTCIYLFGAQFYKFTKSLCSLPFNNQGTV